MLEVMEGCLYKDSRSTELRLVLAATGYSNATVMVVPKPNPTNTSLCLVVGFTL